MSKTTSTWYETEPDTIRPFQRYFRIHLDHAEHGASVFVIDPYATGPHTAILTQISPFEARELAEVFTAIANSYN